MIVHVEEDPKPVACKDCGNHPIVFEIKRKYHSSIWRCYCPKCSYIANSWSQGSVIYRWNKMMEEKVEL